MIPFVEFKRYVQRALLIAVASLAVLYAGDYLFVRMRAAYGIAGSPFATVGVIDETTLKNGSEQIFYRNPVNVTCVRSLFPHLGYSPCWVLRQSILHPIG